MASGKVDDEAVKLLQVEKTAVAKAVPPNRSISYDVSGKQVVKDDTAKSDDKVTLPLPPHLFLKLNFYFYGIVG